MKSKLVPADLMAEVNAALSGYVLGGYQNIEETKEGILKELSKYFPEDEYNVVLVQDVKQKDKLDVMVTKKDDDHKVKPKNIELHE
jgi:hypothetical protein